MYGNTDPYHNTYAHCNADENRDPQPAHLRKGYLLRRHCIRRSAHPLVLEWLVVG